MCIRFSSDLSRDIDISLSRPAKFNVRLIAFGFSLLELPIVGAMAEKFISQQIANLLLYPRCISVPIMPETSQEIQDRLSTVAKGILTVVLVNCQNLAKSDLITNSSDPFVILTCGDETKQTDVMSRTLNPVWDKSYEFTIFDIQTQELKIQVSE